MQIQELKNNIEIIWNKKQNNEEFDKNEEIKIANEVLDLLDGGKIRVAEKNEKGEWITNEWIKKAILLSFSQQNKKIEAFSNSIWFDKCDNKFANWTEKDFQTAGIRAVAGAFVRKGAFFEKGVVIMPSFVNIGANVGEGTMIDSMTTIGSCCQIGKHCHISANVCIGGVLEPLQATPVIIEDNCFIGAGSMITEGVIIGEGSVIAGGVVLSSGVKIINRATGEVLKGKIPPYSVVVAGTYKSTDNISINCAVIIKQINEEIRKKTSTNDLLRQ